MPPRDVVQRRLYRQRHQIYPPLPHTAAEATALLTSVLEATAEKVSRFKFIGDGVRFFQSAISLADFNILIFATDADLGRVAAARRIFLDGTFRTVPRAYYQLFTVHAEVTTNYVPPLVYMLMTRKTQESYEAAFTEMGRLIQERHGVAWAPDTVTCDYETGLLPAIRRAWPGVRIAGCFFHYISACWKHIKNELKVVAVLYVTKYVKLL
jgi:hypothetical protein